MDPKVGIFADPFVALRRAGGQLSRDGRRLLLIEAFLICLVTVSAYMLLYSAYELLLLLSGVTGGWLGFAAASVYALLNCALTLFVTLPLLIGFLELARQCAADRTPVLIDLFLPFASKERYRRALQLSWGAFVRMLCVVSVVAATCGTAVHFFAGSILAGLICGVVVLLEIAGWTFWVLRRFFVLGLSCPRKSVAQARAEAERLRAFVPYAGERFFLASLPRILLGLLTLGVYLLWDVIPRMSVAYHSYCNQLNEIIRSEDIKEYE